MDLTILLEGGLFVPRRPGTGRVVVVVIAQRMDMGQASVMNKRGCVCLFRWTPNVEK